MAPAVGTLRDQGESMDPESPLAGETGYLIGGSESYGSPTSQGKEAHVDGPRVSHLWGGSMSYNYSRREAKIIARNMTALGAVPPPLSIGESRFAHLKGQILTLFR